MRLWPRSLLWRTFLLLALLVIASTAAWFQILNAYELEPRARQIAQLMVSIVNLTRTALITSQPDKRSELLFELQAREGIQIYPSEPDEQLAPAPERPLLERVHELVREQLGQTTRFASARNGRPGVWISFRIDDDEYWVRIPRERVERPAALRWLGWGALAMVLALLAAYLIVSRLNRPLAALARAAAQIGQGRIPEPVPEIGPEEVKTLSHAFNQMLKDLARLESDRALILAGVSHDLRTPLSRLRLGVEMSGSDEALKSGMIADIEEMDRIVGQFLDFARSDGGEPRVPVSLSALAADVLEQFHRRGKEIAADLAPVPPLALQAMAMRRVIFNLLDNALRYAGREVRIATRAETDAAVLEVSDRGPGIPEAELERIKQPFTRLEPARSDRGGAGLGLAIVERVVRAHGGRFELVPREGGGLLARIRLPLAAE